MARTQRNIGALRDSVDRSPKNHLDVVEAIQSIFWK